MSEVKFNKEICDEIDKWVAKFPVDNKKSALIHTLEVVQRENNGLLNKELMNAVADYLDISPIEVYSVATFYHMYDLDKVYKYKILLCTNVSCMLCDCNKIAEHIKNKLKIDFGQISKDSKFFLKEVECLGACDKSPVMMINDKYYTNLTIAKVDEILESCH